MSSFVVTPLDPIPELPPGPQPTPISSWQLDVKDSYDDLREPNVQRTARTYRLDDQSENDHAEIRRAAYLRLDTPTPLRPVARKPSLPRDCDWVAVPAEGSTDRHRQTSPVGALDLDSSERVADMEFAYEAADISDLRGSRTPPGHLSAFERTPRSSIELSRRRTSSGVSSTSSKRDQFSPPALLSPVATSTGTEPTFDVYARHIEAGDLSTSSTADSPASPASAFGVTTALTLLRRLTPGKRQPTTIVATEPKCDEPEAGDARDDPAEDRRIPSTSEDAETHPSRQASSEEHIRVSGTFGVRDSFASTTKPLPTSGPANREAGLPSPPGRYLRDTWQSDAESQENLQSDNHYDPSAPPASHFASEQRETEDEQVRQQAQARLSLLKQRRRDTFIVGNYDGSALAEAQSVDKSPVSATGASIQSATWAPQGALGEIFPGSDWKLVAPLGRAYSSTRATEALQAPTDAESRELNAVDGSRASGLRLASLTESDLEEEQLSRIQQGPAYHPAVERSLGADGPRIPFPPPAARPILPDRGESLASAPGNRQRSSDTALLLASSILSQHAATMLHAVTVQHSEALKLRQMAHDALDAGRLLLELAGTDETDVPDERPRGGRAHQRQAAYEALTSRTTRVSQSRSRSPTMPSSTSARGLLAAADPRVYRVPPTAMLNARAVVRARSASLPGELLSDVERLSKLGWDKMHEAEQAWQQMIELLKQNLEAQQQQQGQTRRGSPPRLINKLKRRSASPILVGASKPRPILSPTASMRRSESDSMNRPSQQVRFAEAPQRKPRKRWFSFLRRRSVSAAELESH